MARGRHTISMLLVAFVGCRAKADVTPTKDLTAQSVTPDTVPSGAPVVVDVPRVAPTSKAMSPPPRTAVVAPAPSATVSDTPMCDRYMRLWQSCASTLPEEARGAMQEAFETFERSRELLKDNEDAMKTMEEACATAADAIGQACAMDEP